VYQSKQQNVLLFENYGQEVGDQYIVGPQPKSWGPVSPVPTVVVPMCRRTEFLQPMRYFLRYPFYHYNKFTIRCSGDFEGTLF